MRESWFSFLSRPTPFLRLLVAFFLIAVYERPYASLSSVPYLHSLSLKARTSFASAAFFFHLLGSFCTILQLSSTEAKKPFCLEKGKVFLVV